MRWTIGKTEEIDWEIHLSHSLALFRKEMQDKSLMPSQLFSTYGIQKLCKFNQFC